MKNNGILSDNYRKITILNTVTNEILAVIDDENKGAPINTANKDIVVKLTPYYD